MISQQLFSKTVFRCKIQVESRHRQAMQRKLQDQIDLYPNSDDTFAYIVGYTSWGFPYGVTWEELGKEPPDFDEHTW